MIYSFMWFLFHISKHSSFWVISVYFHTTFRVSPCIIEFSLYSHLGNFEYLISVHQQIPHFTKHKADTTNNSSYGMSQNWPNKEKLLCNLKDNQYFIALLTMLCISANGTIMSTNNSSRTYSNILQIIKGYKPFIFKN